MRRFFPAIVTFAVVTVLASCGKDPLFGSRNSSAIKLTVNGSKGSKASVITTDTIKEGGFNISAYVTKDWRRDVIGSSDTIPKGIFIDPGDYTGPYDERTYPVPAGNKLKDILVTYDKDRYDPWRITGNDGEGYANHKFSWVNGVEMYFFSYAPVGVPGLTIEKKDTSVSSIYPFIYTTPVTDGKVVPSACSDLIFAFTSNTAEYDSDHTSPQYGQLKSGKDKIDINFHHALAQIRFCLSTDDGTYDDSFDLVSVSLKGINSKGKCEFDGSKCTSPGSGNPFDWTALEPTAEYFQAFGSSFASGEAPSGWTKGSYHDEEYNLFTNTDVFFVIPQSLGECRVEVKIKQGENTITLKGSLPVTTEEDGLFWEAGKYYTYKIGTGGDRDNLSLTMTLADWAEREDYIPID